MSGMSIPIRISETLIQDHLKSESYHKPRFSKIRGSYFQHVEVLHPPSSANPRWDLSGKPNLQGLMSHQAPQPRLVGYAGWKIDENRIIFA